jgi:hypothetical protein
MKLWAMLPLLLPLAAHAQGLVLGGDPPPAPATPTPNDQQCASVSSSTGVSYGCINAQQKALVAQQKAGTDAAGLNQNSAPPSLGLYNQAATKEHLGDNFGHSVYPQRPPPPHFATPLIPPK